MDFDTCKTFVEADLDNVPEELVRFYGLILEHVDCMQNNKPITMFDVNWAKSMVLTLMNDCVDGNGGWKHLQFLEGFTNLIFNWNSNLLKDESIDLYCRVINRIIMGVANAKLTIRAMQETMEHFTRYHNWFPPAYDLSIPYLEALMARAKKRC